VHLRGAGDLDQKLAGSKVPVVSGLGRADVVKALSLLLPRLPAQPYGVALPVAACSRHFAGGHFVEDAHGLAERAADSHVGKGLLALGGVVDAEEEPGPDFLEEHVALVISFSAIVEV